MSPKPSIYTSKAPLNPFDDRAVPKGATQAAVAGFRDDAKNPSPLADFMPFVDNTNERSEFWRALIVTFVVLAGISALGVGFVLSQRLNSPPETMALTPKYIDSSPNTVSANVTTTRAPTPKSLEFGSSNSIDLTIVPTPRPTSQFPSGVPSSFVPFFVNPFSTQSATLLAVSGTITPTGSISTSPTPTGSITISPTITLTPTTTISPTQSPTPVNTSTPTPTPEAYLTTNIVNDTLNFGSRDILDGATTQTFNIYNVNDVNFVVNKIDFSTTGPFNPYSVLDEDTCLTNTSLPVTMSVGQSKCIKVQVEPTALTNNTNYLLIFWYTWRSSNVKIITLTTVATTPTPTVTITPTFTVTPTPTPESYLTTNVLNDVISFGTRPLASGATTQTFNVYNVNDVSFVVNKLDFATTGPLNPYSILAEDGCITNVTLPVTMTVGQSQCIKVQLSPGDLTINTNYLLIFWYTWRSSNVKVISLTADVTTPTPTPIPETPTTAP